MIRQDAIVTRLERARQAEAPGHRSRQVLLLWHTRDRKTQFVFWTLFVACILMAFAIITAIVGELRGNVLDHVNKIALFWSWSKFIHVTTPATLIYNPHVLFAFEHHAINARAGYLPFAYPPSLLLLIWPLALLAPAGGLLLWLGVSVVLYGWACWHRPWGPSIAMLSVVAPSTLTAMYYGQVSLLVAAFMIGGCRLVDRRPTLAGVLFGLASCKPQFGLLVPIALISARQWRCLATAATTVIVSVIASGMAFGWATWLRLPFALADVSRFVTNFPALQRVDPTVAAAFSVSGSGPVIADLAQLAAATVAIGAVWVSFRGGFTLLGSAALMVGTFLVTPYAVFYDLPMVSYAVLAIVIDRNQGNEPFGTGELILLILVMALPFLITSNPMRTPLGVVPLALLFGMIVRRIAATSHCSALAAPARCN